MTTSTRCGLCPISAACARRSCAPSAALTRRAPTAVVVVATARVVTIARGGIASRIIIVTARPAMVAREAGSFTCVGCVASSERLVLLAFETSFC